MPITQGLLGERKTYDPDIIDLVKYEGELLYFKKNGGAGWPPPPIPGLLMAEWSTAEMEAMRDNRDKADAIYKRLE